MPIENDHRSVLAARRRFFEDGRAPRGLVPDAILRSWIRCAGLGLEAAQGPQVEMLNARELREASERHERLRRLCRPELELLHADARDTGSVVILTDANGLVLDTVGDTEFAGRAAQVALRPGVAWGEAMTGTNAIGTALVERRPIEVRGAEHYFVPHRILSCYAAPILDPRGQVAGALDLSGHAAIAHMHALGMVRLAVDQIERRLFDGAFRDCDVVRVHRDPALLGTAREGILVFDDYRLIAANRHGLALFGLDWEDLGKTRYTELFSTTMSALRDGADLRGLRGQPMHGHIDVERSSRPRAVMPATPAATPDALPVLLDAGQKRRLQRAARMLDANLPVLLQGETGAGKEVFARRLHAASARSGGPFVAVNCAALPEGLIEAELFGYEDGAFTGARKHGAAGLLRQADGGVLFLDEIGDMPLSLQSRLLRVLQEREVTPLGGGKPVAVNFALVCATHQALDAAVAEGRFRADLYYRIAQYSVLLPPLRDHVDLHALIAELWSTLGAAQALPVDVLSRLAAHVWPGNYRELLAVLRTLRVLAEDGVELNIDDLPPQFRTQRTPRVVVGAGDAAMDLQQLTDAAMQDALESCKGNVSAAARRLGVSRSTLYRRVLASAAD
ncbi:sigma-54-dependent Fis family transcriptional regulator [Sinimarinibacterium sp. CAU 1509]|uniref:sigma-54-dependent Fis family transcriptional regulator n=1 Tax=Sinimarinibacterium sp. CAU 1509 TaxID=2562283 RepID=UPI0010ABA7B4|nr:sigma-54-dependent Fis family transcriptional regulator [Sinimarinibacterium sp. CAU 1509]TJY62048.1 sigma-54-dependent Fis family transcriptional regulator [Sinimarinibacterium sp. CAU 1509]